MLKIGGQRNNVPVVGRLNQNRHEENTIVGGNQLCVRFFRYLNHFRKSACIEYCKVGKHLAVDVNDRFFQPAHKLGVAHIVHAGPGVDAGDPQSSEISLLGAPVAIGVG